jgi:CheY-like chemotaxis protein
MGGQLSLNSQLGTGTNVIVLVPMPVSGQAIAPSNAPLRSAQFISIKGAKVLVVEDDPVNSMLACEVLNGAGAEACAAGSGEEAIEFLRTHDMDLVLMDFRMPGMDGLEATRRLRAGEAGPRAKTLPVLGLTANAFVEDREQCLEAGMSDVLTKPIESRALIMAVGQWMIHPDTNSQANAA